ncbi:MAG TPA: hypothetical protein VJT80_02035 [Steroidobacteraceae bacterium]|nr:hypothetical protein [Steroidobacteraceae bacterium]
MIESDATWKPAAVLEFLQLEPGMHVLDIPADAGYYSEIMARVVGPKGRVVALTYDEKARNDFADPENVLAALYRALKPGGIVGVIDFVGKPGDPRIIVNQLHRIDPARVRTTITRSWCSTRRSAARPTSSSADSGSHVRNERRERCLDPLPLFRRHLARERPLESLDARA